jgi:hypothetical protein
LSCDRIAGFNGAFVSSKASITARQLSDSVSSRVPSRSKMTALILGVVVVDDDDNDIAERKK